VGQSDTSTDGSGSPLDDSDASLDESDASLEGSGGSEDESVARLAVPNAVGTPFSRTVLDSSQNSPVL
jgi:hypothetical protein